MSFSFLIERYGSIILSALLPPVLIYGSLKVFLPKHPATDFFKPTIAKFFILLTMIGITAGILLLGMMCGFGNIPLCTTILTFLIYFLILPVLILSVLGFSLHPIVETAIRFPWIILTFFWVYLLVCIIDFIRVRSLKGY